MKKQEGKGDRKSKIFHQDMALEDSPPHPTEGWFRPYIHNFQSTITRPHVVAAGVRILYTRSELKTGHLGNKTVSEDRSGNQKKRIS